ncbi:hypothetical protein PTI98_013466 [Pleurotus ostreatus]|nr:hypothetical protein PTI98_013466 [Pleurotus ostreatus]
MRAPRSTLPRLLPLRLIVRSEPVSTTRRSRLPRLAFEFRRLSGSIGDIEGSRWGTWNDTDGDPKDEDNEGGGTEGYDRVRETDPKATGGLESNDPDEGGVVACVSLLKKLAGLVDTAGENKNGPSEEGECDNGVLPPDGMTTGRWTWDVGRGMGTLCVGRECGTYITDDGDDEALEIGL